MEAAKDASSVVRHAAVRIGAGLSRLQPPGWTSFGASFASIQATGGLEIGVLQIPLQRSPESRRAREGVPLGGWLVAR
jgi:hypothetical protein